MAGDSLLSGGVPDPVLEESLESGRIIPDVVPCLDLKVKARFALAGRPIVCGEQRALQHSQAGLQFVIDPEGASGKGQMYSVVVVDPDVPLGLGPILHYAAVNVSARGGELGASGMGAAAVLQQWEPPAPPARTGLHRYVILVYRQPGPVNFVEAKLSITKFMFDLEEWTGKLRLGDPVAASYFTCEYEPGCHASCLLSALCCAFCCWTTPSRDFHRRARESGGNTGAAPPRARRGGAPDESVHMA
ncbi:hypothetical protein FNF31_05310 [Cafeteria roenbergensis]|nr:hypothetical protein FNF31_05310 [Cafeteria roenbergensis]KAA0171883.1 hypothetical protein FNF28_00518 [Cafeteria roenbergensis]